LREGRWEEGMRGILKIGHKMQGVQA